MKEYFPQLILSAVLLTAACTDIRQRIIPNVLILSAIAVRFFLYIPPLILHEIQFREILIHIALSIIFPTVLCLIAGSMVPGGIGMGDIKLMIVIAFYLDFWGSITAYLFSFLLALIIGLCCFVFKTGKDKTIRLPLAPAFFAGTLLAYFIRL